MIGFFFAYRSCKTQDVLLDAHISRLLGIYLHEHYKDNYTSFVLNQCWFQATALFLCFCQATHIHL